MKRQLLLFVTMLMAVIMPMKLWAADSGENTDVASDWTDSKQWIELTPNLWHIWGSEVDSTHCKADAVITGEMTPAWNLNTDIGAGACILGSENILWNQYADLSKYDKLIIFGTGGPGMRIMCNRIIDTGALKRLTVGFNEADSHWNADLKCLVIDLSEFKTMSCTATGESDAEGFKTGDERIDDFVHLHCLKNDWGGEFPITVTGVYVWKEKNEYPEPYAVLSENNTKLTFFYDDQKAIRGGMSVGPFSGKEDVPWYNQRERIITVEFDPSFANCTTLTSTAYWFNECDRLSTLIGIGNLKTNNVTNMYNMFSRCSSLTSLDLSTFKTDNVTNMGYMFFSCYNLTNLNLSNFKTGNVKSMYGMFMGCSSLTSLDLSHFNTANVTSMLCMFYGCSNLTSLDISGFNTASVTEMGDMFNGCSGLTSLDVNNFNTANVESMFGMFNGCSSLTSLDLSTFKTDNVTTMGYMFNGCSGLTSLDVSGFNTAKVADMVCMFTDCSSLTSLDVSHFNTENVLGMSGMFSGCSGLKTIYAGSEWTTAAVTEGSGMFSGCTSLEGGAGTPYDSIHVDVSYAHIDGGENNPGYLTGRYGPNVLSIADITLPLNNEALLIVSYQFDVADKYVGYQFDLELPEELEFVTDDGNHVAFVKGDCHDDSYSVNANLDEGVLRVAGFSQYSNRTITGTSGVLLTFTIKPKSAVSIGQSFTGSIKNIIIATVEEQKELAPSSFTVTISQQVDPEPYAVLSENNTKLTFFYDDKKAVRNGMDVGPFTRSGSTVNSGWNEQRDNITTVEFDESFANCTTIGSTSSWFYRFSNLTSIVGLSNLKTDNVIDMSSMFSYCSSLTSLDLSSFNTENVTDISRIFKDCTSLVSIKISSFNTANVTLINGMFDGCSSLAAIDVSGFNTSKATDMGEMFAGCSSLKTLDLRNFNTANATRMHEMFAGCSGLTSINVSSFNTANVTDMDLMFGKCSSLTSLDLSSFNTANIKYMSRVFEYDSLLTTIYAGNEWSTEKVSSDYYGDNVFNGCISLVGGSGTPYDANHVDYTYAHIDGGESNPGYLTWKGEGMTVNKLYIIGSGTAGEWNATTEMPFNDATKAFEYTIENTSTAWITFGIQPLNGDWGVFNNNYRYAIGNGNVVPVIGQEYQLVPSPETGSVMIEEKGKYFISVTKDLRMTIIKEGDEQGTNIYVESEQAPYLYAFDANDQALNGEFPGNQMTKTVTIDGKQFWTTKISSTDPFNINIIDGNQYRTREIYVISDRYFTYLGLSSYRDVTEQYANAPEIQISSIALTGNHNEWGRNDLFTEVEPGKQYTMDVDLTNVTLEDDVMQFKLYANACAWLGITSLTLEAPSYVHSVGDPAVGASSRNIYMDLNEAPTRHFKFEAVWRGGTQMEEGWTLTITEVNPAEAEPYAVLSDNNTKLTFFYDEKKATRGGMSVGPFLSYSERGWHDQRESITNVVFDTSFAECTTLTSTAHWFYGCENLTTITDISNLRTDNVTRMRYMFRYCSKLTSLGVSGFKTDNVTDMLAMFSHCSSLTSLDVSGFNTENVTDMRDMFDDCSKLTTIDVSHFNTEKVTNMSVMFQLCTSLTNLDLSNFNTSNVTNTQGMFYGCSNLVNLDIRNFDMSKVNNEEKNMFVGCSSLASIIAGNANILAEEYANIGNPNLLVYVNEARLAPSNVQNVVINGMAREIVLTDVTDGNNDWYAPLAFVAERISYTRNFTQSTTKGTSRGWESIALPFRVQTIQHETKGVIAPFNNSASNKHFWLRRLGDNGLQAATSIEANTPYVISMPNSEEYTADYNLNGRVTFSAQNVDVPATVTNTLALADSSIVMVPAMQRKERSSSVWALNVGEVRGSYFEGSVFERDYREVRPFEAYTVHRLENGQPAPRYVPLMDIGGTTGIETIDHGPLTIDRWYDLEGRKLQGKPTQKGVYISNGRKVVVK